MFYFSFTYLYVYFFGINWDQLLGELVSVISHLGGAGGGHWISYHQVDGNWFINNDSNPVVRAPYHPFNSPNMRESVNLCLFLCT